MASFVERFPKNFKFATATAAYQIEGARHEDGRVKSAWDAIRDEPGRVKDASSPLESCEARWKYIEDIQLLKRIGVNSYRMSICWSRLLNDNGEVNPKALQYYDDVCRRLCENNIEPIITLFHFDMPLRIYNKGSWLNEENCKQFIDFCDICFKYFGKYCKTWITFNELSAQAWTAVSQQKGLPYHCPSRMEDEKYLQLDNIPYRAMHNMILTHARIYHLYSSKYKPSQNGIVGLTIGGRYCFPASQERDDLEATRRAMDWLVDVSMEPILGKSNDYPESMKNFTLEFTSEEKQLIKGTVDFIGVNYYLSHLTRKAKESEDLPSKIEEDGCFNYEEDKWERICGDSEWVRNVPQGLTAILRHFKERYNNVPVMITENGCMDLVGSSDPLNDQHRVKYVKDHLVAVSEAIEKYKCNVIGYCLWSLMDNFEWDDGFAVRFGICRVDLSHPDKPRTMKASAHFYRQFIDEFNQNKTTSS